MKRRLLLGYLLCGVLCVCLLPASAAALDLVGWLRGDHRSYTAVYLGGGDPGVAAAPGTQAYLRYPLLGPRYGSIPGVPSYNWGYFGAPYRPVNFCHEGYYGECSWWRYRRR